MKYSKKVLSLLMAIVMIITNFCAFGVIEIGAAMKGTEYSKKYLQNGGFEQDADKYTWTTNSGIALLYTQPQHAVVPYWNTTAYNTNGSNGKLEFFKDKALHFNQSSTANRVVAEGDYAAELNADEVSTIYQRVETVSGSTYTWGLDHRGRDTTDTMVLFIGPEQYKTVDGKKTAIDPSKPDKNGEDQFVQMTEWLKKQYGVTYPEKGCSQKYTVYSKPFDKNGKFQNETTPDENFSMTQTEKCTEEWNLWVISSSNENKNPDTDFAVKGWSKYGTNCYKESDDSYHDVIKGVNSKLKYDCTYTVPKGQTKTLFAFTSYSSGRLLDNEIKPDATYGNLLDDINFKLYQPISSSITPGGSGGVEGGKVTVSGDVESDKLFTDVTEDGKVCKIYTAKSSADDKYKFVGAYITETANDGTESTRYVSICQHDLTGLTKEKIEAEHASVGFVPYKHDENVTDDTKWDYYFILKVNNPVHIHMIYTKAPYAIYDANGGLPYQYGPNNESGNDSVAFGDGYYTGGPETVSYYKNSYYKFDENNHDNTIKEKGYYYSHTAYDNPNWKKNSYNVGAKFVGWSVLGKDNNMHVFDAKHKIEYEPIDNNGGSIKIFNVSDADENGDLKENANAIELALNENDGVTLTAQWKFGYTAQAQTLTDSIAETYENTALGGWVEETFINDRSNVDEYSEDINGDKRVEHTDAYGSVGEKIIFRATADSAKNYVFEGWYTKEADGTYKLVTTAPNLAVTVEQGNSEAYYARFKTKTFPVVFHYSPTGSGNEEDYVYYDANESHKYGKYFQNVEYKKTAEKPKDDSQKVTMWFTSPTERDQEHMFNFSTQITKETHLYASPMFNFNYYTGFSFTEPWIVEVYATLLLRNDNNTTKYVDMKSDPLISDFNTYMLTTSEYGDTTPKASEIKDNTETVRVGKNKDNSKVLYNSTTNTQVSFNRCGAKLNNAYIFNMHIPTWVVFDFTYNGITYTSAIADRCLYNEIDIYMKTESNGYFTTFPKETQVVLRTAQTEMLKSIRAMNEAIVPSGITAPTEYKEGVAVTGLTVTEDTVPSADYNFNSTTAIRNIEPWGFKYSFNITGTDVTSFSDYGAVVLTDTNDTYKDTPPTIYKILNNSNSLLYSKSMNNYYTENGSICVHHVNGIKATDFEKNTYAVFFVKDNNGKYHYSKVITNSYNTIASNDTSDETAEISKSIKTYSEKLIAYYKAKKDAASSK